MRVKGRPRGSPAELKDRRVEAMRLPDDNKSLSGVARLREVSVSSVHRWKEARKGGRLDGKRHPGPTPRLTASQKENLKDVIMKLALTHGCEGHGQFSRRVAEIIERQYGVSYSLTYIGDFLRSFGLNAEGLYRQGGGTGSWRRRRKPCTRRLFF